MPAGTWNLPRLLHKVEYVGLRELESIVINDDSPFSDHYFNIIHFPDVLTSGKNLFKLQAKANTLVPDSIVHFEILDENGDPIYYEPLSYVEQDGTRVVTMWCYRDTTPPGTATVYVAGRARINRTTGDTLPFSEDVNDPNYKNIPNVMWTRTITVAPAQLNSTEIIFERFPTAQIQELVLPFLQPTNVYNYTTIMEATNGQLRIYDPGQTDGSIGGADNYVQIDQDGDGIADVSIRGNTRGNIRGEDQITVVDSTVYDNPLSEQSMIRGVDPLTGQPIMTTMQNDSVFSPAGFSRCQILSGDFKFSASMAGGILEVRQPSVFVEPRTWGATFDVTTQIGGGPGLTLPNPEPDGTMVMPSTQAVSSYLGGFIGTAVGPIFFDSPNSGVEAAMSSFNNTLNVDGGSPVQTLSGSYKFAVSNVINDTTADVFMLKGFANDQDNVVGKFNVNCMKWPPFGGGGGFMGDNIPQQYSISQLKSEANNFTGSFVQPFTTVLTPQSQSYCEIKLANLDPAAGDIYKVRTYYKAGGAFGEYLDGGETVLEQIELLEDSSSFESDAYAGLGYNRMGFFTSNADFAEYFTVPTGDTIDVGGGEHTLECQLSHTYDPQEVMGGIKLKPELDDSGAEEGTFSQNQTRYALFHLSKSLAPTVYADTSYIVSFNAYANDDAGSTDSNVPLPRIDVYVSGSTQNSITADENTIHQYVTSNDFDDNLFGSLNPTPTGRLDLNDGGPMGTRIGSVELQPSASAFDSQLRFSSNTTEPVNIFFVIRRGTWTLANISMRTLKETGYTPNYTRIFTRVNQDYLNTPLTFKFVYYNYLNQQAPVETYVYPVLFNGSNQVIGGDYNVISGSVSIGEGTEQSGMGGIELSGKGSAYIRSSGYKGFNSASAGSGSGFIMYSGSVLNTVGVDDYSAGGIGLEMVQDSGSYFKFRTLGTDKGLDIKTPRFFMGEESSGQFISGANGQIEITSSNFHLKPDGKLIMQGTITAEAGGTIGGFSIDPTTISSSNDALILRGDTGQITASAIQLINPKIKGAANAIAESKIKRNNDDDTKYEVGDTIGKIAFLADSGSLTNEESGSAANIVVTATSVGAGLEGSGILQAKMQFQTFKIAALGQPLDTFTLGHGMGAQSLSYPGATVSGSLKLNTLAAQVVGSSLASEEDNVQFAINARNQTDQEVPWVRITNASGARMVTQFVPGGAHGSSTTADPGTVGLGGSAMLLYSGSTATTWLQTTKQGWNKIAGRVSASALHVGGSGLIEGSIYAKSIDLTDYHYGAGSPFLKLNSSRIDSSVDIGTSANLSASGSVTTPILKGSSAVGDQSGSLTLSGSLTFRDNRAIPAVSASTLYVTGSDLYFGSPAGSTFQKIPIAPKMIKIYHHNFFDDLGTAKVYVPWYDQSEGTIGYGMTGALMPFDCKLRKVILRIGAVTGTADITVSLNSVPAASTTATVIGTKVIGVDTNSDNDHLLVDFTGTLDSGVNTVEAGKVISIGLQAASNVTSNNYVMVTSVWEIDLSTEQDASITS